MAERATARYRSLAVSSGDIHPRLAASAVEAFETANGVALPGEYRDFVTTEANGGALGPEYGLLELGAVPDHWTGSYAYGRRLREPFPLTDAWVWSDEFTDDSAWCRDAVAAGHLLLGEEGCGARWSLVVTGASAGQVWLLTDEGAVPTPGGMGFADWLTALVDGGVDWWSRLVAGWGPSGWLAMHPAKRLLVRERDTNGRVPQAIAQATPLCVDCVGFLHSAAAYEGQEIRVTDPHAAWRFTPDGSTVRAVAPTP